MTVLQIISHPPKKLCFSYFSEHIYIYTSNLEKEAMLKCKAKGASGSLGHVGTPRVAKEPDPQCLKRGSDHRGKTSNAQVRPSDPCHFLRNVDMVLVLIYFTKANNPETHRLEFISFPTSYIKGKHFCQVFIIPYYFLHFKPKILKSCHFSELLEIFLLFTCWKF